jgi:hypothetical protein
MSNSNKENDSNNPLRKYLSLKYGQELGPDGDKPKAALALPKEGKRATSFGEAFEIIHTELSRFSRGADVCAQLKKAIDYRLDIEPLLKANESNVFIVRNEPVTFYHPDATLILIGATLNVQEKLKAFQDFIEKNRPQINKQLSAWCLSYIKDVPKQVWEILPHWMNPQTTDAVYQVTNEKGEQVSIFTQMGHYEQQMRSRPSRTLKSERMSEALEHMSQVLYQESEYKMGRKKLPNWYDFYFLIYTSLFVPKTVTQPEQRKTYLPLMNSLLKKGQEHVYQWSNFFEGFFEALADLDDPSHLPARKLLTTMANYFAPYKSGNDFLGDVGAMVFLRQINTKSITLIDFLRAFRQHAQDTGDEWYSQVESAMIKNFRTEDNFDLFSTEEWLSVFPPLSVDPGPVMNGPDFVDLVSKTLDAYGSFENVVHYNDDEFFRSFFPEHYFGIVNTVRWKEKIIYCQFQMQTPGENSSYYTGKFLIDFSESVPKAVLHVIDDEPISDQMNYTLVKMVERALIVQLEAYHLWKEMQREQKAKHVAPPVKNPNQVKKTTPQPQKNESKSLKRKQLRMQEGSRAHTSKKGEEFATREEQTFVSEVVTRRNLPIFLVSDEVRAQIEEDLLSTPKEFKQVLHKIQAYNEAISQPGGYSGDVKRMDKLGAGPQFGQPVLQIRSGEYRIWAERDPEDATLAHVYLVFHRKNSAKLQQH